MTYEKMAELAAMLTQKTIDGGGLLRNEERTAAQVGADVATIYTAIFRAINAEFVQAGSVGEESGRDGYSKGPGDTLLDEIMGV